jgi:Uma2 family endonuclease
MRDADLPSSLAAEHLMSMPALNHWALEDVERVIGRRKGLAPRYELVDGELLVTPAPSDRHQDIVGELYVLIREYVRKHGLGRARFSPSTVTLTPQTRVEPDLYVVPVTDSEVAASPEPVTQLLLAVEVLSPSSARHDRITKRRFFQQQGVPEYWVIDGEAEIFEIWKPGDPRATLIDDRLVWRPREDVAAFELDARRFFAELVNDVDSNAR